VKVPPVTHAEQKELVWDRASHRKQVYDTNRLRCSQHPTQRIPNKRFRSCVHHTHNFPYRIVCDSVAITNDIYNSSVCVMECITHGALEVTVWHWLFITHIFSMENVCARWPNANSCPEDVVCDCSFIQHAYFLETMWVVFGHHPRCFLSNRQQKKNPISRIIGLLFLFNLVIKLTFHMKHAIYFIFVVRQPGFHN
jgi:hypothetical protein